MEEEEEAAAADRLSQPPDELMEEEEAAAAAEDKLSQLPDELMEEEEEEAAAEDRLSQLPDAVLQHILSFTVIKQAVQTSILSKRWQNLWLSMSDLDFDFTSLAAHSGAALTSWQASQDFSPRFHHFVSQFLSHRDGAATVRKFHLSLGSYASGYMDHAVAPILEKYLHYAITHGVQHLHLHDMIIRYGDFRFPDAFFASKTLRELKLTQLSDGIYLPKQFCLPHLNTLYLERSYFISDGDGFYSYCKEPFSGFPELEKLTLKCFRIEDLVIFGPKLRILEIIQSSLSYDRLEEIRTPRLTSFRYESYLPLQCLKLSFPMLEETYLNIIRYPKHRGKWMTLKSVEMLQHFGHAKVVKLSLCTLKVLEMDRRLIEQSPSPFPKMRCLKLMKAGRREIPTVHQRVMNYLTAGSVSGDSLRVEIPEGVSVTEEDYFDEDYDELQLEQLFQIQELQM